MKRTVLIAAISLFACGGVLAQTAAPATCKARAADQHLAGAALKSFMTKCQREAADKCKADSVAQNLKGAAAASHTKKCTADAIGS
jgi:hypothetical protein